MTAKNFRNLKNELFFLSNPIPPIVDVLEYLSKLHNKKFTRREMEKFNDKFRDYKIIACQGKNRSYYLTLSYKVHRSNKPLDKLFYYESLVENFVILRQVFDYDKFIENTNVRSILFSLFMGDKPDILLDLMRKYDQLYLQMKCIQSELEEKFTNMK